MSEQLRANQLHLFSLNMSVRGLVCKKVVGWVFFNMLRLKLSWRNIAVLSQKYGKLRKKGGFWFGEGMFLGCFSAKEPF